MPDTRVEDEILAGTFDGTEQFYVVQSGVPRKATTAMLNALIAKQGGPFVPNARLTLSTGVPVSGSDNTAATILYLTATGGQYIPYFDGISWGRKDISTDLILPLDSASAHTNYHASGHNYDVWLAFVGGTAFFGTGPKWDDGAIAGSNILRGTGAGSTQLGLVNGITVNQVQMQLRYGTGAGDLVTVPPNQAVLLGSIRTTADGQCEDSESKRFVSNFYNTERRSMSRFDTTDSWTYSVTAYEQARASAANQVSYLHTAPGRVLTANVLAEVTNSTSTGRNVGVGIGLNSSTVNSANPRYAPPALSSEVRAPSASYRGMPGLGYFDVRWLEYGNATGGETQTWYGDAGLSYYQGGLSAETQN